MEPSDESEALRRLHRAVKAASDITAIRFAMNSYLHTVHSPMSSYYHYPPIGAADFGPDIQVYYHGWEPEWVEAYRGRRMIEADPMPRVAATQTRPFRWADVEKIATLTENERKYLVEARSANLGAGIAVPVFGPNGRNGYFAISFGTGSVPDDTTVAEIHWACQAVHLKFCEQILQALPDTVSLSDRERQILGYLVRGHSNQVIATKLSISTNTVDTYVRRCFDKLDVHDRVTAGLRGLALGLVA